MSDSGVDKYKGLMNKPKPSTDVYSQFIGPIENKNDNVEDNNNLNINPNDNLPDNIDVKVITIPVVKKKKSIRETHKNKGFYIRKDIAKLIESDIKNGQRGDMTVIINALFEEYYRSQGRLN